MAAELETGTGTFHHISGHLEYEQEIDLLSKIIRVLECNPVLVKYYTGLSLGFGGGSETFRWLKS